MKMKNGGCYCEKHDVKNCIKCFEQSPTTEAKRNPYKGHECDGGDDYGRVGCFKCEKEMLWYFSNSSTPAPSSTPMKEEHTVEKEDYCSLSERVDGKKHGWKFDGDDPYVICHWCKEVRDAITDVVIRPGLGTTPTNSATDNSSEDKEWEGLDLILGEAPVGTLKHERSQQIKVFIKQREAQLITKARTEVLEEVKDWVRKHGDLHTMYFLDDLGRGGKGG